MTSSRGGGAPGRALAAAATVLAVVAMFAHGARGALPAQWAGGKPALELVPAIAHQFISPSVPAGTYVAYGLSTGAVHEPVQVVAARPIEGSGPVEYVRTLVAYYACPDCTRHPGTYGLRMLLGSTCGSVEPHGRALFPAVGHVLVPGDAPHFIVVGRVTGPGPSRLNGVVVTYRTRGHTFTATSPAHSFNIDPGRPTLGDPCAASKKDVFFGGSEEQYLTKLLE